LFYISMMLSHEQILIGTYKKTTTSEFAIIANPGI